MGTRPHVAVAQLAGASEPSEPSVLEWWWGRHRGRTEERPGHGAEILTAGSGGQGAWEEEPGEAAALGAAGCLGAQVTSGPLGTYRLPHSLATQQTEQQ